MLKEFKEFITKGNLLEIATGLILALAFKAVVDSVVNDILTPIVSAVFSQPNFDTLSIHLGDSRIFYGRFINAVISFLIIGFVLFLIMKAYNALRRQKPEEVTDPGEDVLLLREIRDLLRVRS